jgi:uncharacterized DUF497 family protein
MHYVWDPDKQDRTIEERNLRFGLAKEVFRSIPPAMSGYDDSHSFYEDRFKATGATSRGILTTVYTIDHDLETIRVVSLRKATTTEKQLFREQSRRHQS